MKYHSRKSLMTFKISLLLLSIFFTGYLQVLSRNPTNSDFQPKIRGAIMMANSHAPHAIEGGTNVYVIPTWGFDLDYFFHPRWSVALQGDLLLQSFEVDENNAKIERSYPFSLSPVIHFHARRHWSFYGGPGYEFERHESLFLIKLGTEYSFEITESFEIALNIFYENKQEIYDSWTFGIAFNKKLWEKKK